MQQDNSPKQSSFPEEARRKRKAESEHWWDRQHSVVFRQTPKWAQTFVLAMLLLGSGAITAGFLVRIDEVVSVKGKLEPNSGTIEVKTPAGGLISNVYVKEGEAVSTGQTLVSFDTRNAAERIRLFESQLNELILSQKSTFSAMQSRKQTIRRSYLTNVDILERMRPLLLSGAVTRNMVLAQEDKALSFKAELSQIDEEIAVMQSKNRQAQSELKAQLVLAKIQEQYEIVKAPMNGIIFQLKASPQGVLNPSEPILKIIPQDGLQANVYITNKDIGYVKIGQEANIRVDAFDYSKFGSIPAKVQSIGADVLPPDAEFSGYRFPLSLSLSQYFLEAGEIKIPLRSGLAVTANIRLRDKRLIALLTDMFTGQFDSLKSLRQ